MAIGWRALWLLRTRLRRTPLRQLWIWRRHKGLEAEDSFLACYPRSGSNWLQFMIFQALTGEDPTFKSVHQFSPYLGGHGRAGHLLPGGGRFIKTHEAFFPVYRRAVLLIRDPRDVVLSDYRYLCQRDDYPWQFAQFVSEFVAGRAHGFGSWGQHLESWLDSGLSEEELLVVRYEDLREAPETNLARVLSYLGVDSATLELDEIVNNNKIDRMRAKEQARLASAGGSARPRYVRHGRVGRWQTELTEGQRKRIETAFGAAMVRVGYELGSR